jgi:hypothetical protein
MSLSTDTVKVVDFLYKIMSYVFVGFTLISISIGSAFLFISALGFMMAFQSILLSILILIVFIASYIIGRKIIQNFDEGELK